MGKIIYKILFTIQSFIARTLVDSSAEVWYRNSLLQDYFSFGKSDIDVTVVLKSDHDFIKKADAFAFALDYCPLIKEINFYFPFSLKYLPMIANQFELKKDPKLSARYQADTQFPEAQKLVYLLRMYFSNLSKKKFTERDVLKWKFHFRLTGKEGAINSLNQNISRNDLLQIILNEFNLGETANGTFEALWYAAQSIWDKTPLFDQYRNCKFKDELYNFLPHQFCFVDPIQRTSSSFSEQVFVTQLSWEIMGMMNQPEQFLHDGPGHAHLNNIRKTLEGVKLNDVDAEIKKLELKKITEAFADFLNLNPP